MARGREWPRRVETGATRRTRSPERDTWARHATRAVPGVPRVAGPGSQRPGTGATRPYTSPRWHPHLAPGCRSGARRPPGRAPSGALGAEPAADGAPEPPRAETKRPAWWAAVGLWVLIAVPFVVAVIELARPRWFPVLDLAQTELRIRDVASSHPPLIGLPGPHREPRGAGEPPRAAQLLGPLAVLQDLRRHRVGDAGRDHGAQRARDRRRALDGPAARRHRAPPRHGALSSRCSCASTGPSCSPSRGTRTCRWPGGSCSSSRCGRSCATTSRCCPSPCSRGTSACRRTSPTSGLVLGLGAARVRSSVVRSAYRQRAGPERKEADHPLEPGRRSRSLVVLWIPAVVQQLTHNARQPRHHLQPLHPAARDPDRRGRGHPDLPDPPEPVAPDRAAGRDARLRDPGRAVPRRVGRIGRRSRGGSGTRCSSASTSCSARRSSSSLISMSRIFGYLWFYLVLWSWAVTALMLLADRVDDRGVRRAPGATPTARPRLARIGAGRARRGHRASRSCCSPLDADRRRVAGPEGLRGARRARAADGARARQRHGAGWRARRSLPGDLGGPGQHRWAGLRAAQRARAVRLQGGAARTCTARSSRRTG